MQAHTHNGLLRYKETKRVHITETCKNNNVDEETKKTTEKKAKTKNRESG